MVYKIYIKSHCDAPDFEAEVEANNKRQAARKFYMMLKGEFDYGFVYKNIVEEK